MKQSELKDILYRQSISLGDKSKLYNFIKQFLDLFDGEQINSKYLTSYATKNDLIDGVASLERNIVSLQDSIRTLDNKITSSESGIESLNETVTNIIDTINKLDARVATLESYIKNN